MTNRTIWAPRTIHGVDYTFDHLLTYRLKVSRPERSPYPALEFDLVVIFDCHVVTEACEDQQGPAYWQDSAGNCREFNEHRFQRSKELPVLIKQLVDGDTSCYEAKKNNYMVWKPADASPDDPPYLFFFDLYRSPDEDRTMVMYIQSAYEKDQPWLNGRENRKVFLRVCAELMGIVPKKTKGPRSKAK